jgi:hypothetical protein
VPPSIGQEQAVTGRNILTGTPGIFREVNRGRILFGGGWRLHLPPDYRVRYFQSVEGPANPLSRFSRKAVSHPFGDSGNSPFASPSISREICVLKWEYGFDVGKNCCELGENFINDETGHGLEKFAPSRSKIRDW